MVSFSDKQEEIILKLAKMAHINNAIWSKLDTAVSSDTIKDFTCDWEDLTEYQKELYIDGIVIMVIRFRQEISPMRWFWKFYYKYRGF